MYENKPKHAAMAKAAQMVNSEWQVFGGFISKCNFFCKEVITINMIALSHYHISQSLLQPSCRCSQECARQCV